LRHSGCAFCGQIEPHHHRALDAGAVLVSSMLSAALRPGRWPGLRALTTPARGTHGNYAMVVS
jgi:hypothetical protein